MTQGRPPKFDRQEALEKSMELFWKKGYEATSLADLLEAMGIGRQSLYNTFGDKHRLFLEAAKHYIDGKGQHLINAIQAPGSPIGSIKNALTQLVESMSSGECHGCLVTNSIVELAPHDDEVHKLIRSTINRVEKAMKTTLDRAVTVSEISPEADTRAMARFLNSTVHGLVVMHKASTSKAALKDIVKIALTTLK
jgi:TetR/AcrR family transcriptional repressor of nem operon